MLGAVTRHFEREVRLDRCAYVGRPFVVDRPAAILVLAVQDFIRALLCAHWIFRAQQPVQQNVVRNQGGISAQLAAPVALFRVLRGEQVSTRAIDGRGYPALDVVDLAEAHLGRTWGICHRLPTPPLAPRALAQRQSPPRSRVAIQSARAPASLPLRGGR